jgi:hypothetical protein
VAGQLPPPPAEKDGTLARMAFLDVVEPLDRLDILLVEEGENVEACSPLFARL